MRNTLIVVNDREAQDLGSVMYVVSIANPTLPTVSAILPLGLTGSGRGSGHIANFVKTDCSQAWVDGGDHVEVVDLTDPTAPRSLGKFESAASMSDDFKVSHDTELDSTGTVWYVGGGGAAGYKLTADPLAPAAARDDRRRPGSNPSPYNDFILHNSQRRGKTLLDHRGGLHRHRRGPAGRLPRPGQVRDLGPLADEQGRDHAARTPGRRS